MKGPVEEAELEIQHERMPDLARLNRQILVLYVIQGICLVGFGADLLLEFPDPRIWRDLSTRDLHHLISECLMLALLAIGFGLATVVLRGLHRERGALRDTLRSLRGDFDRILNERFDQWALTPAQRDVALLTLRGLRLSEIAQHRGSAEGTIKAHLGAVFRAAGVRTRSELVGVFMEEFLDFSAAPQPRSS